MHKPNPLCLRSPLAPVIEQLIEEKRACGYQYITSSQELAQLDRFLDTQSLRGIQLPRETVRQWVEKRPNEGTRTHQVRVGVIHRLAEFMVRLGHSAYVCEKPRTRMVRSPFVARIFSHDEIGRLLLAAERLRPNPCSPYRHLVLPELS